MKTLSIPNPIKDLASITYNLPKTDAAESRVHEIAIVNVVKAPELMTCFLEASFELSECYSDLLLKHRYAEKRVSERRAVIILDILPSKLAEKKLSSNESVREAIVETDKEYTQASYIEMEIHSVLALVKEKMRHIEAAHHSVRTTIKDMQGMYFKTNPSLSVTQGSLESEDLGQFGRARY